VESWDENKIPRIFEWLKKQYDYVTVISHNEQIKCYTGYKIRIQNNNNVDTTKIKKMKISLYTIHLHIKLL